MTRTITAYFDTARDAERAALSLGERVAGLRGEVLDGRTGRQRLEALGLPAEDAAALNEGIRRGGGVVHARVPDDRFDEVASALEASGAADLDAREAEWRKEGWSGAAVAGETVPLPTGGTIVGSGMGSTGSAGTAGAAGAAGAGAGSGMGGDARAQRPGPATDEARIPVAEERLRLGRREVGHGRVRIRSYVVETPGRNG